MDCIIHKSWQKYLVKKKRRFLYLELGSGEIERLSGSCGPSWNYLKDKVTSFEPQAKTWEQKQVANPELWPGLRTRAKRTEQLKKLECGSLWPFLLVSLN